MQLGFLRRATKSTKVLYLVDIYPNESSQDINKAKVLIICYTITTVDRMWHDPIQDSQTLMVILEAHNFDPYAEKHCTHTVDLEALLLYPLEALALQ